MLCVCVCVFVTEDEWGQTADFCFQFQLFFFRWFKSRLCRVARHRPSTTMFSAPSPSHTCTLHRCTQSTCGEFRFFSPISFKWGGSRPCMLVKSAWWCLMLCTMLLMCVVFREDGTRLSMMCVSCWVKLACVWCCMIRLLPRVVDASEWQRCWMLREVGMMCEVRKDARTWLMLREVGMMCLMLWEVGMMCLTLREVGVRAYLVWSSPVHVNELRVDVDISSTKVGWKRFKFIHNWIYM